MSSNTQTTPALTIPPVPSDTMCTNSWSQITYSVGSCMAFGLTLICCHSAHSPPKNRHRKWVSSITSITNVNCNLYTFSIAIWMALTPSLSRDPIMQVDHKMLDICQIHDIIATPWQQMQSTKSVNLIGHGKFLSWQPLNGCSVTRPSSLRKV